MNFPNNFAWKGDTPTELVVRNFNEGVIKPGDKILDIGSGFGRNSNWLATKNVLVTAINIDQKEIKESQKKAQELGVNVNYLKANAISLPFADNCFDVALDGGCTHLIPSLELQQKAETEVTRILKPGGYLIYFGFSKHHPSYVQKPDSPMFRDLEDIRKMYGIDFDILSSRESRWQPKPEEKRNFSEHVGLEIVLKKR
jgi:ubiquinone/menaquinone biosynthesis C-methylase UbiE